MPLASLSDKRSSWSGINHLDSSYSIHWIWWWVFLWICVCVLIVNTCVNKREYAIILIPNDPIENWATNNAIKKCLRAICCCLYLCAISTPHKRDGQSAKKEILSIKIPLRMNIWNRIFFLSLVCQPALRHLFQFDYPQSTTRMWTLQIKWGQWHSFKF